MPQTDSLRRRAILALVMVNLLWGISFPAMKATNMIIAQHQAAGQTAEPGTMAKSMAQVTAACFLITVRFSIALALLGVFFPRLFGGLTRQHWQMGAWTGLAFAAGFVLQIVGLNYVPASRSGFLTSLTVIFTPLATTAIERRPPRWPVVWGAATALVGTAILTGMIELSKPFGLRFANDALSRIGPGDWLTAGAAIIFTLQILLIDRFSRRMPAGQLTPGMFAATLAIGIGVFSSGHMMQPPKGGLSIWYGLLENGSFVSLILFMSIFCTVLAFYWMNKYQAHVTPAQAALIYTLEPIFATLWAMVLPGVISSFTHLDYASERPGWPLLVGGVLVVAGNAMALWPEPRKKKFDQPGHAHE